MPLNDSDIIFINRDFAAFLGALVLFCIFVRSIRAFYPSFLKYPSFIAAPVDFTLGGFKEILIIFIIRAFCFEMYLIPSGSMQPTLYPGDLVLVNKYSYGIKMPGTNNTLFSSGSPQYGDTVVFLDPQQPTVRKMIKRLIGLPGDHIRIEKDKVFLNGQQLRKDFHYKSFEYLADDLPRFETFFYHQDIGHRSFDIEHIPALTKNISFDLVVPPAHYFVLGDNRDNSIDSRYWGFVPERFLCGKAEYILMSFGKKEGRYNLERVGGLS